MQTNKLFSNRYYICLKGENEPIPWNPITQQEQIITPDCNYFAKVFRSMEKKIKLNGLIFYLTFNLDELPSYGKNVVAVVLGDEWCQLPRYTHKILAVFKCYGTHLTLGCNPFLKPSYLNFLSLIQFQKAWFMRLPGWLNYMFHEFKSQSKISTPIYDIPLGYYKQLELPIKDIESRQYDIYFGGSLKRKNYSMKSFKYWLGEPKTISRKKLVSNINNIEKANPDIKIKLSFTQGFLGTKDEEVRTYSENMMETKICPVPRGASLETYRFFEAMRYGCIVITESLPSRWFYNESPAIKINDWSKLEEVVKTLLKDKQLIKKKHNESLKWWRDKCSETAVGEYIAMKLNVLKIL